MNELLSHLLTYSLAELSDFYNIEIHDIEGLRTLIAAIEHDIKQ